MKKSILILSVIALLSFSFFAPERKYELTEGQAIILLQAFDISKKTLPTSSTISANEATRALVSIDSIMRVIISQNKAFVKQDSLLNQVKLDSLSKIESQNIIKKK